MIAAGSRFHIDLSEMSYLSNSDFKGAGWVVGNAGGIEFHNDEDIGGSLYQGSPDYEIIQRF